MQTTDIASSPTTPASRDILGHEAHPWLRYFARIVDMNLSMLLVLLPVIFILVFLLALASPSAANSLTAGFEAISKSTILDILFTCLAWVPLEFLFMSVLGTTPGKWVFGIQVRDQHGKKLRPMLAAKRAGLVYLEGLGCGIPLISLITLIRGYNRLSKESIALWDEQLGTEVTHLPFGMARSIGAVVAVALTILVIFFNVAG